jgi:hypothetical protein
LAFQLQQELNRAKLRPEFEELRGSATTLSTLVIVSPRSESVPPPTADWHHEAGEGKKEANNSEAGAAKEANNSEAGEAKKETNNEAGQ